MHVAYINASLKGRATEQTPMNKKERLKRQAYLTVCEKYRNELQAIQKYRPGWMPRF